ncbi:MAG: ectonucleotide pyrophosphatase/phosphodiesterase [Bdellovibrionota bacterium]
MSRRGSLYSIFASLLLVVSCSTSQVRVPTGEPVQELTFEGDLENSPEAMTKPYVVMVSVDGYRHDYNGLFSPPILSSIEREGVSARSLRPVYPSKTFPNHLSLVTGLYPDKHGIVSNDFYDPAREQGYKLADAKAVEDGTWYLSEPIWVTLQKQGMRTATFFWPGSAAAIQGKYPNYYYRYSEAFPNSQRVDRVLEWLKLPPTKRPHFITLYFSDVDTAGHKTGTKSPELRQAILSVDAEIGRLREGLKTSGLPVNLVIVSDHGMENLDASKVLTIDESNDVATLLPKFKLVGRGPQMTFYLNKGESSGLVVKLHQAIDAWARAGRKPVRVLRGPALAKLHYGGLPRVGDLVVIPDMPWVLGTKAAPAEPSGGNHGWDPKEQAMHGVFFAEGPAFKARTLLPTFDSVNVVPLLAEILGVKPARNLDGKLSVTKEALAPAK